MQPKVPMANKIIGLFMLMLFGFTLQAQTGIGTSTPHASAKLDVNASNKGFLPPRIGLSSTTDVTTIPSPATGLVIYNIATAGTSPDNVLPGYYYWNGSNWNNLVKKSNLPTMNGFVPNWAQSNASSVTKSAVGDIVVSQSITTSGKPVQIIATGDINPINVSSWVILQLYRDGTAIGKRIQAESSDINENIPYAINFIDSPASGTYTYSVKIYNIPAGHSFQFGESDGNHITLLELGTWSEGNISVSKGGTGSTGFTNGSVLYSNGSVLTQNNANLFWDNTNQRLGIGTSSPTQKLEVNGPFKVNGKITLSDASGNVAAKSSGFADAGVPVVLDDIQVQLATSGNRSLLIKTTGTSFTSIISAHGTHNGYTGTPRYTYFSDVTQTINSTFNYLGWQWNYTGGGDTAIYYMSDFTNLRFYRITLMIGMSYLGNMISIEKLV